MALGALCVAIPLATGSCARRAPGPEECHALAVQWVGRERRAQLQQLLGAALESPEASVLERTTECLTLPYDRELLACIGSHASPTLCFRAFQARRTGRTSTP